MQEPRAVTGHRRCERRATGAWELPCAHLRKVSSDQGRSLMAPAKPGRESHGQPASRDPLKGSAQPPRQLAGASGLKRRAGEEPGL